MPPASPIEIDGRSRRVDREVFEHLDTLGDEWGDGAADLVESSATLVSNGDILLKLPTQKTSALRRIGPFSSSL